MSLGLALGALVPDLPSALNSLQVAHVSFPIAVGLILMMYLHLGAAQTVHIAFGDIARGVLVFLGVPLVAGALTPFASVRAMGWPF